MLIGLAFIVGFAAGIYVQRAGLVDVAIGKIRRFCDPFGPY